MSYLLAGGCSFTDENYKSILVEHDTDYEKWPTILAKKLGISCVVNTAVSGGSNDMMFKAVMDAIVDKKPKAVFILMTGWDRVSVYNFSIRKLLNNIADENINNFMADAERQSWITDQENIVKFCNHALEQSASIKYIINNTMKHLYILQEMCYREDVDLVVAQGLKPICGSYFDEISEEKKDTLFDKNMFNLSAYAKEMIKCPYFDKINYNRIAVGWPFFTELGGQYLESSMVDPEHFIDPKLDGHPSGLGHQIFADIFYCEYIDRYLK